MFTNLDVQMARPPPPARVPTAEPPIPPRATSAALVRRRLRERRAIMRGFRYSISGTRILENTRISSSLCMIHPPAIRTIRLVEVMANAVRHDRSKTRRHYKVL